MKRRSCKSMGTGTSRKSSYGSAQVFGSLGKQLALTPLPRRRLSSGDNKACFQRRNAFTFLGRMKSPGFTILILPAEISRNHQDTWCFSRFRIESYERSYCCFEKIRMRVLLKTAKDSSILKEPKRTVENHSFSNTTDDS